MKKKLEQFRLPHDLVGDLEAYSEAAQMTKTEIVVNALRDKMASGITRRLSSRLKAVRLVGKKKKSSSKKSADMRANKLLLNASADSQADERATDQPTALTGAPNKVVQKRPNPS